MVEVPDYASTDPHFLVIRASRGELAECVAHAWKVVVDDVLPAHNSVSWDVLRVELWSDSGTILFYPARVEFTDRIEVLGCQVISDEIHDELRRIETTYQSDEAYDAALARFEARIFEIIEDSVPKGVDMRKGILFWSANVD